MLKKIRDIRGQSVSGEYALLFFTITAAVMLMSAYVKRSIQARWIDTSDYVALYVNKEVRESGVYDGQLYYGYEPYYTNTTSDVKRVDAVEKKLIASMSGHPVDIFRKKQDTFMASVGNSEVAAPKYAY